MPGDTYEQRLVERWLYTVLAADSLLTARVGTRIYNTEAETEIYPQIVYQRQGGVGPVKLMGGVVMWAEFVYLVRGIDKTDSYQTLDPIAVRIQANLKQHAAEVVAGGVIIGTEYEDSYSQIDPDVSNIRHEGGLYKIWAQVA